MVKVAENRSGPRQSGAWAEGATESSSPLATANGPSGHRELIALPEIHRARDGQILFPSRRGPVESVEATFRLKHCTAIAYRGDPVRGDDNSLYLTLIAHDPAPQSLRSRLTDDSQNALVTIRVGHLHSPTNEWDRHGQWLTPELLSTAGIPENIELKMGRNELNRVSVAVERIILAIGQLETESGAWNMKLFGESNNHLNARVLGRLLREHGLDTAVVNAHGMRGSVDLSER